MPLLYFIWKDAGHSWRYGCLCTQFIHRFYRGPFGHLTRERTARRNGLEKAVMLFFPPSIANQARYFERLEY
jgi:hypothetical protein